MNKKRIKLQARIDQLDKEIREAITKKRNGLPEINVSKKMAEMNRLHKEFAELKD